MLISYLKEYNLKILLCTGFSRILRKLSFPQKILVAYDNYKHKVVQAYLYEKYSFLINKPKEENSGEINKRAFVFWWQGEDNAPELVKICINSIRKRSGLEVILISQKNIGDYIDIPSYIFEKVHSGKMGLAVFSDYIRFNLLYKYGGIWLDATDFVTGPIPESILEYSFYSAKNAYKSTYGWKWTSFFMAAKKGDYLCGMMVDFYNRFWKDHKLAITYLFLDCWLTVLYKHNINIKNEIDTYPEEDYNIFALTGIVNSIYSPELYAAAKSASFVHKLSYKDGYRKIVDGQQTVWGYIVQNENFDAGKLES